MRERRCHGFVGYPANLTGSLRVREMHAGSGRPWPDACITHGGVSNAGYTLMSTLCALLIAAVVFTPLTLAVHRVLRLQMLVRRSLSETSEGLRLHSLLYDVASSIDQHRFMLLPRLQEPGAITFTDGSPNSVMHEMAQAPDARSGGLTTVSFQAINVLRVQSCTLESDYQVFNVCAKLEEPRLSDAKAYAALGSSGFEELTGDAQGSGDCRVLALTKGKSMSFMQKLPPCSARMIFPIEAHFTLYLNSSGELRLLSHKGEMNIENQPLMRDLVFLRFGIQPLIESHLYQFTLEARLASNRSFYYSMPHRLGRTPFFNFLLNL